MAQIASDLENNHTGRKLSTMAIRLGFLIEISFIKLSSGLVPQKPVCSIFDMDRETELCLTAEYPANYLHMNSLYCYLSRSSNDAATRTQ